MQEVGGSRVAGVEGEHFAGESFRCFVPMKSECGLGAQEKRLNTIAQGEILVKEEHRG